MEAFQVFGEFRSYPGGTCGSIPTGLSFVVHHLGKLVLLSTTPGTPFPQVHHTTTILATLISLKQNKTEQSKNKVTVTVLKGSWISNSNSFSAITQAHAES